MKILDLLNEDRNERQASANTLRKLYDDKAVLKNAIKDALSNHDEDAVDDLYAELDAVDVKIKQAEGKLNEGKNHMGEREYQSYSSWKAACKKAHPGCGFRGDKDIGAAVVGNKDVGEWDGAVGSVYATQVNESVLDIADLKAAVKLATAKMKDMQSDLKSMDAAARSEKERDAGDEFRKKVERQERLVDRGVRSLRLHKAARDAGV